MKPVMQLIMNQHRGDCMTACVASILEQPSGTVPPWVADAYDQGQLHRWYPAMLTWLNDHGYGFLAVEWNDLKDWRGLQGCLCIASMPSQRFAGTTHAVVATWVEESPRVHQLKILHDPSPLNIPYTIDVVPKRVYFLIPRTKDTPCNPHQTTSVS